MNEVQKNKNVVILGCGWLGKIVGSELANSGFKVFGSIRDEDKSESLKNLGIQPFILDTNVNSQISTDLIDNTSIVLMFFPPSIASESRKYHEILEELASRFHENTRFIFTSSTGVYPQQEGTFDESWSFTENDQNNRLKLAENTLRHLLGNRLTIIRPGGLIGPDRHPIYSLQGRQISHDGNAPVNLIHGKDISGVVLKILESGYSGGVFNLVFPHHPTKKEYYQKAAEVLSLDRPEFGSENTPNRLITGDSVEHKLDYKYRCPIDNFLDFKR